MENDQFDKELSRVEETFDVGLGLIIIFGILWIVQFIVFWVLEGWHIKPISEIQIWIDYITHTIMDIGIYIVLYSVVTFHVMLIKMLKK